LGKATTEVKADRVRGLGDNQVSVDHVPDLGGEAKKWEWIIKLNFLGGLPSLATSFATKIAVVFDGGERCCLLDLRLFVREFKGIVVLSVSAASIRFGLDYRLVLATTTLSALRGHGEQL
jgi:hypothetical protein